MHVRDMRVSVFSTDKGKICMGLTGVVCTLLCVTAVTYAALSCNGRSMKLPTDQCTAWVAFYDSTGGNNWTHCSGARTDPCSCETASSDVCDTSGSSIHSVRLQANNLIGTLPDEIGAWKEIKSFAVDANQLRGSVPSSVGRWTQLRDFHLDNNLLSGTLPALPFEQLEGCGLDSCCVLLMDSGTNGFECPWPEGAMKHCTKATWDSHVRVTQADCKPPGHKLEFPQETEIGNSTAV